MFLLSGMGLWGQNWVSLFDGVSTAGCMAVAEGTKGTGALYSRMAAGLFNESGILPALSAIAPQNHSAECCFRLTRLLSYVLMMAFKARQ